MARTSCPVPVRFVPAPDHNRRTAGTTVPVTLGELRDLYACRRRTRQLRRLVKRLVKELRDARADHRALAADVWEDAQIDLLSQLYDGRSLRQPAA